MAHKRSFTGQLCRAARLTNNIGAAASGHPKRIVNRAENVVVGRVVGRAGVWRRLWR